jgi:hypothetical protein
LTDGYAVSDLLLANANEEENEAVLACCRHYCTAFEPSLAGCSGRKYQPAKILELAMLGESRGS